MSDTITLETIGTQTRDAALFTATTIDEITQISQQMNMLGLNARIEAARVGAEGVGFAVVANEVREVSGQLNKSRQVWASDWANSCTIWTAWCKIYRQRQPLGG